MRPSVGCSTDGYGRSGLDSGLQVAQQRCLEAGGHRVGLGGAGGDEGGAGVGAEAGGVPPAGVLLPGAG
ncbi:hypothetical protein ABGB12_34815 [Actinocorallia sp. B10E7]|uniref:hypothetical protein n=1 Tax=Actinocorallia sp. B10E7 TaxID=3153558 RepID=UPI00325E8082